jgi:hypothetical protein
MPFCILRVYCEEPHFVAVCSTEKQLKHFFREFEELADKIVVLRVKMPQVWENDDLDIFFNVKTITRSYTDLPISDFLFEGSLEFIQKKLRSKKFDSKETYFEEDEEAEEAEEDEEDEEAEEH